MKIVYIAHPIGGDVAANVQKILAIVKHINMTMPDIVPFAPYIVDVLAMNDDVPLERERGIRNCFVILNSEMVDQVWLYGHTITPGMKAEVDLAIDNMIPVFVKDPAMELPYGYEFIKSDIDEDNEG